MKDPKIEESKPKSQGTKLLIPQSSQQNTSAFEKARKEKKKMWQKKKHDKNNFITPATRVNTTGTSSEKTCKQKDLS